MGVGKLFTLLLGLSPVVAVLLYFVLQQQAEQNVKQDTTVLQIQKEVEEFNQDFSTEKMLNADNKQAKVVYAQQVLKHNAKVKKIEEQQEQNKKRVVKQTDQVLKEIDNELNQEDFDF